MTATACPAGFADTGTACCPITDPHGPPCVEHQPWPTAVPPAATPSVYAVGTVLTATLLVVTALAVQGTDGLGRRARGGSLSEADRAYQAGELGQTQARAFVRQWNRGHTQSRALLEAGEIRTRPRPDQRGCYPLTQRADARGRARTPRARSRALGGRVLEETSMEEPRRYGPSPQIGDRGVVLGDFRVWTVTEVFASRRAGQPRMVRMERPRGTVRVVPIDQVVVTDAHSPRHGGRMAR